MLTTHAMQILLLYQDPNTEIEKSKLDDFLEEVRVLAKAHDINFKQYESFSLPGSEYRIAPCSSCAELTINANDVSDVSDVSDEVKEMVSFF